MMSTAKQMLQDKKNRDIDSYIKSLQKNVFDEKALFNAEIKICIAYCESLFEAGVFNRLEAEKVKNALQTISKRADFDKNYFINSEANDVNQFIEGKLINLIGDLGQKLRIGRSPDERHTTALRLYLCDEILETSNLLRTIQRVLVKLAQTNSNALFITELIDNNKNVILFAHWCLSHFEVLKRDRERLDEVWRRVNTMPLGANYGLGTSLEFDRTELANKLGFQRITNNSLDAIRDQGYFLELANCVAITATNLLSFINELSISIDNGFISFSSKPNPHIFDFIKANLEKVFIKQFELQSNLRTQSLRFNKLFSNNSKTVIEIIAILNSSLNLISLLLYNHTLEIDKIEDALHQTKPDKTEIMDYLIQRGETVPKAENFAELLEEMFNRFGSLEKTPLGKLKEITDVIEDDFYSELSLETIHGSKNQIGGTSPERVNEALTDAMKALEFEE